MAIYGIEEWTVQFLSSSGTPVSGTGLTTTASIPNITQTFDSDKRSGYAGVIHFAKALEFTGEASFGFKHTSEAFQDAILQSIKKECSIQLNAAAEDQSLNQVIAYELILRGLIGEFPSGGDFTSGDLTEFTLTFYPNRKSRTLGTSTFLYDPRTHEWTINGTNELDAIKAALGL